MKNKENEKILKENTNRVVLNVPILIDERFKDLAIKRGIAKSQMIIYAMSWFLDYNKSMDMMPKLLDFINSHPNEINNIETLYNTENK